MENRSVVWDVACSPSFMIRSIRLPRARRGAKREDEGEHADRGERQDRDELAVRAEEERDAENRQQFADRTGGQDVAAEPPREQVVLTQDRQQRAQRRRGQTQRDRHERVHETDGREDADQPGGERDSDHPADQREPPGPLAEHGRVELVAGQQEHQPEADVGDQGQDRRIGQTETLRPDHDPADDQQHDLRHPWPGKQRHDQRGERRDNADHQQRIQHAREIVHVSPRSRRRCRDPEVVGRDGLYLPGPTSGSALGSVRTRASPVHSAIRTNQQSWGCGWSTGRPRPDDVDGALSRFPRTCVVGQHAVVGQGAPPRCSSTMRPSFGTRIRHTTP